MTRDGSRLVTRWGAGAGVPRWRWLEGSAVLADLTGFTRLTERLTDTGREGTETLHRVMSLCFATVLGGGLERGGDVIAFAGDAALLWFGADEFGDHVERAVDAAAQMVPDLAALPAAITGGRRLRVSTGVHTGRFFAVLPATSPTSLLWCGAEVSTLAGLESSAGAGQVVVSDEVASRLPATRLGEVVGPGRRLRGRARRPEPEPERIMPSAVGTDHGEHRTVSIGFVQVLGTDDLLHRSGAATSGQVLIELDRRVRSIAQDEGLSVVDTDLGVDGVKFLVAAGLRDAVTDDDGRLVRGLARIVGEVDVPEGLRLRAGGQRGRVYAASFGVPGRTTFTALGDPVNVAARALGAAASGEVVVADGLAGSHLGVVESLGARQLRNRTRPMELWRIVRTARPGAPPASAARAMVLAALRDERDLLEARWKRTVDDRGGVVDLVGDEASGVTDLLAALVDATASAGGLVQVDPSRASVPYSTFRRVVEVCAPDDVDPRTWLSDAARRIDPMHRAWAEAAIVAAFGGRVHGVDPLSDARRAAVALAAVLLAALPRPFVLAVTDSDLADEASSAVFARLAPALSDARGLLVLGRSPAAATSQDADLVVTLPRLDDDRSTELVIDAAPRLRDDEVAAIVRAAGGYPVLLAELVSHPLDGDLPDSLERLASLDLDALPLAARDAVSVAAVIGATAPLSLIAAVTGRPELSNPPWWESFTSVVHVSDGAVSFRHEAARRVAYERLAFRRRRDVHGRIADLLRSDDGPDAEIARHLDLADRSGEAYPVMRRAARAARSAGAITAAVALLQRAAALADRVDPAAVASIVLDEAEARSWIGDLDGAARGYRRASRLARDPLVAARACHLRADLALRTGRHRQARDAIRSGNVVVAAFGVEADPVRCRLLLDQASLLDIEGRHRQSIDVGVEALAVARRIDDPVLVGLAHLYLEMSCSALLDPAAIGHGDEAMRIFAETGHDRYLDSALTNTGLTAMYLGRWDLADDRYRRAIDHAERTGHTVNLGWALGNLGFLLFRQGRRDEADHAARRAIRLLDTASQPAASAYPRVLRSMIAAADGAFEDADRWLGEARAAFADAGDSAMVLDCDVTAMSHLLLAGRASEARAEGRRLESLLDGVEPELAVTHARVLGHAEAMCGDRVLGEGRVRAALGEARRRSLRYEEMRCLEALAALGTADASALSVERDELAASLGVVHR
jgi:class 3 adenylate cyclase/tetratricopeptide (TPR) repeat protein